MIGFKRFLCLPLDDFISTVTGAAGDSRSPDLFQCRRSENPAWDRTLRRLWLERCSWSRDVLHGLSSWSWLHAYCSCSFELLHKRVSRLWQGQHIRPIVRWERTVARSGLEHYNYSVLIGKRQSLDLNMDSILARSWCGQHNCLIVTWAAQLLDGNWSSSCSMVTGTAQLLDGDWNSVVARWWLGQYSCSIVTGTVFLLDGDWNSAVARWWQREWSCSVD